MKMENHSAQEKHAAAEQSTIQHLTSVAINQEANVEMVRIILIFYIFFITVFVFFINLIVQVSGKFWKTSQVTERSATKLKHVIVKLLQTWSSCLVQMVSIMDPSVISHVQMVSTWLVLTKFRVIQKLAIGKIFGDKLLNKLHAARENATPKETVIFLPFTT